MGRLSDALAKECRVRLQLDDLKIWIDKYLDGRAKDGFYLIDLIWDEKSGRLEVFVDSDNGIRLSECKSISRDIEGHLDSTPVDNKYTLIVSSPGVKRPLKINRQYTKNVGRVIEVEMGDGVRITGKLKDVDDDGIAILPEILKKKKRPVYNEEIHIKWENIKQSIVQIRF